MIRLIYWLMVIIELLLFLFMILIFILTDSRTIHITTENILKEYNIEYKKISGNLFSGIEVLELKYGDKKLVDSATIYWNPFALLHKKVHVTKLELDGVDIEAIMATINSLPKSNDSAKKIELDFSFDIERTHITANPFFYHGVEFKNFFLGIGRLDVDRELEIKSSVINLSLDSDLVNIDLRGKIEDREVSFDRLNLKDINTKVITRFVQSINAELESHPKEEDVNKESDSKIALPIDSIKIDNSFISLDRITYGPITLEKTELKLEDITIDPKNSFSVDAKKAVLMGNTSFADTKQVGYVKDSMLYATGDVITRDHLFDRYSLPLNRKGLRRLPTKLQVNHRGLWVDIDSSNIDDLLVLNNSFNVNLKETKHRLDYIYLDMNMTIKSKAKATMSYGDDCDIENLVVIDIENDGYTTYEGDVDIKKIKKIKNIPDDVVKALLGNLKATYKGDADRLLVLADSKQIEGSFLTDGYSNAKMHLESKNSVPIVNLLPSLPKELKESMGDIKSDSFIDFHNNSKTEIGIDITSDILDLNGSMGIIEPYKIEFVGAVPKDSQISKIDKRIKVENIGNLNGRVILDFKKSMNHISLSSERLKLSCDYNSKNGELTKGLIEVGDENMAFEGNFDKVVKLSSSVKDMQSLNKIIKRYYSIPISDIEGRATVEMKINADTTVNLIVKGKNINFLNLKGNIDATINIDKSREVDIEFNSKKITYDDIKFHSLSGKLSVLDEGIEVDRYSFKLYNDYISHFFSNRKSYLSYHDGVLYAPQLWIRDDFVASGEYNIDTNIGKFEIGADRFSFKNSDFDIVSSLNLKLKIDKERFFISGDIRPLGNSITYEVVGSGVSKDSDIVIVQEQKEKKNGALNSIKTYLTIEGEDSLRYITDDIDIEFTNDIALIKDYDKDFQLWGVTTIKGGHIKQGDKEFFLDESHIYFSGSPSNPIFEIKANYYKEHYDIQIFISGTADDPIINFNSNPYLTQKEILSLILFDSTGTDRGSGTELYALLGGTFAKELMESLGISVDHLILGQGIDEKLSVEVGQKISDNITVIYQHNNGKDGVKVRVDHSNNFETDIIIQPPNSSSIEFLYKQDR